MSEPLYAVRNYRPSDLEDYVKLKITAQKLRPVSQCHSPQAIRENLKRPNYLPEKDLFVIESAGKIVGFMDITPELYSRRVILDCLVHPEHQGRGLARRLLTQATRRAKELGAEVARVNISQENELAKSILPRLGFRAARRFLELKLSLDEIQLPDISHSVFRQRHLKSGEEEELARIQNRCFADTWEYNPNTPEEIAYLLNLSHNSPEDVILIYEEDKLVAYCWTGLNCETEADLGRILMIGVEPDHRGRGIGRVALLAGLAHLKSKGVRVVELTVDSENEAARALYRSAGFKDWSGSLWYEKALD